MVADYQLQISYIYFLFFFKEAIINSFQLYFEHEQQ